MWIDADMLWCDDVYMRTTLTIDDDVLLEARALAEHSGISLGAAVSELARRGLIYPPAVPDPDRPWMFRVHPDAAPITNEDVYKALNDWP